MRARLALLSAGVRVELREVVLRDKPAAFLAASPSATVPCLLAGGAVIDESLDIMRWALARNDPDGWLDMPDAGHALIATCDGAFKTALDGYKYAARHPGTDPMLARDGAAAFLCTLEEHLGANPWLFGPRPGLADMAILPFVRQFAHVDQAWFAARPWPHLIRWLEAFKGSDAFAAIMVKYTPWQSGAAPVYFPQGDLQHG